MIVIVGIVCFMVGVGIGSAISGHVAYKDGVIDESRKFDSQVAEMLMKMGRADEALHAMFDAKLKK